VLEHIHENACALEAATPPVAAPQKLKAQRN
jgi:hypothetical protein